MSRITIHPIGVDNRIAKKIYSDPELSAILMYFIFDHPGDKKDDDGNPLLSVVSIKELCEKTGIESEKVAGLRVQRLIDLGVIEKYTPEFYGGLRMPSSYRLNLDSEIFYKGRKRAPARPPTYTAEEMELYSNMIEYFITKNQLESGQTLGPSNEKQRDQWMLGCRKLMKLQVEGKPVDYEVFKEVIDFLAKQLDSHVNRSDRFAMRVFDIPNMNWQSETDPHPKFIKAFMKMKASRTKKEIIDGNKQHGGGHGDAVGGDLWQQI